MFSPRWPAEVNRAIARRCLLNGPCHDRGDRKGYSLLTVADQETPAKAAPAASAVVGEELGTTNEQSERDGSFTPEKLGRVCKRFRRVASPPRVRMCFYATNAADADGPAIVRPFTDEDSGDTHQTAGHVTYPYEPLGPHPLQISTGPGGRALGTARGCSERRELCRIACSEVRRRVDRNDYRQPLILVALCRVGRSLAFLPPPRHVFATQQEASTRDGDRSMGRACRRQRAPRLSQIRLPVRCDRLEVPVCLLNALCDRSKRTLAAVVPGRIHKP